jgi:hypothetical protein
MNKKMKSLVILATGLILGTSVTALADPFSNPMTNDLYNGNTPNGIPTPYFTTGLGYNLFDAANLLNPSYAFQKNENLDSKLLASDSLWTGQGGSVLSFFVIGRSARNVNSLGYYTRDVNNNIIKSSPLLTGVTGFGFVGDGQSQANGFDGVNFTPSSNTFGWYIESTDWRNGAVTPYYSEAQENPEVYDHLITYALPELKGLSFFVKGMSTPHTFTENAYLIGFKDRLFGDYSNTLENWPFVGTLGDEDFNDIMILVDSTDVNPALAPPLVPEPATITLVATGLAGLFLYGRRRRQ